MKRVALSCLAFSTVSALFVACGASERPATFDDGGVTPVVPSGTDDAATPGTEGSLFGDRGGGPVGCVGLECSEPECGGQNTTKRTGKVLAANRTAARYQ